MLLTREISTVSVVTLNLREVIYEGAATVPDICSPGEVAGVGLPVEADGRFLHRVIHQGVLSRQPACSQRVAHIFIWHLLREAAIVWKSEKILILNQKF